MFKFNGFTHKANEALNLAIESAQGFGHTYIGSEHILIGLLRCDESAAGQILADKGVTAEKIEAELEATVGRGNPTVLSPDQLTPRAKRIIEMSIAIARSSGCSLVGTEHLLAAILEEGDNYAVRFISKAGGDCSSILQEAARVAGSGAEDAESPSAKAGKSGSSKTPTLDKYGRDLTAEAKAGKLDPVIGRAHEIERIIQILTRRTKNNPCLIGEPGVGKTAVVEGLAIKIADGEVPELLKDKRVVSLDLTGMVAGTKYRGDFEERVKAAIDEVVKSKDTILFIDEVHTLVGAGSAEGSTDAANMLKPQLARGEVQIIGATTLNEYRKYIEKDAALERRFQPLTVGEPNEDDAVLILKGLRDKYEAHHKVRILDEALEAAVKLSSRYITDRYLPDKAIDLIDEAASRVKLRNMTTPTELKELEDKIKHISEEKTSAVNAQDFERAARLRDSEKTERANLDALKADWQQKSEHASGEVTAEEIAEIVSSWTGVPVAQLTEAESERLLKLESILHQRVIGQDEAVTAVAKAIRRGRVGLKDPKRPIGSFIFLGPTGVGKTELCRALAESMFGDENAIIKLDMSEFMEKHTVSKLIGSPPGYVGYDEGGQLTEKVRRKPYSVVLFDEIEKAHPDVFNMLLQILEDGVLTDSQGRHVNFKNTVIIMTSNVGARLITENRTSVGFGDKAEAGSENDVKNAVLEELKRQFKPEFLNRIDDIIVFNKLSEEDIRRIAANMLATLTKRVKAIGIDCTFDESAVAEIAKEGFDPVYGARPLRRSIQSRIEDSLSERILEGVVKEGDSVRCTYSDGEFRFVKAEPTAAE